MSYPQQEGSRRNFPQQEDHIQYINKNNVKVVNNSNLTLNVHNFNHITTPEEQMTPNTKVRPSAQPSGKASLQNTQPISKQQMLQTQRYSRENSLSKLTKAKEGSIPREEGKDLSSQNQLSHYLRQQQQNLSTYRDPVGPAQTQSLSLTRFQGQPAGDINTSLDATQQSMKLAGGGQVAVQGSQVRNEKSPNPGVATSDFLAGPNNPQRGSSFGNRNSSASQQQKKMFPVSSNIRSSTSTSILNSGAAQRKNQPSYSGQASGQVRQPSYGAGRPTSSTGFSHYSKPSMDKGRETQHNSSQNSMKIEKGKQNQSTSVPRTNNSMVYHNQNSASASKNSFNPGPMGSAQASKNRSTSRTSGHSATGTTTPSNSNMVNSKMFEQQQIINKHVEKEKRYLEKIKQQKTENRKLVQLLKDSETLFYQKIQEAKQQSSSLSVLIKQLWPIIKTRVKDPVLLQNTINQCMKSQSGQSTPLINDIELVDSSKDRKATNESLSALEESMEKLKKQHQKEIQELQQAFQEQIISMDNHLSSSLAKKEHELTRIEQFASADMLTKATSSLPQSSALRALTSQIEFSIEEIQQATPSAPSKSYKPSKQATAALLASSKMVAATKKPKPEKRGVSANPHLQESSGMQIQQQRIGRNQRQQSDVLNHQGNSQIQQMPPSSQLQYSKSASNINKQLSKAGADRSIPSSQTIPTEMDKRMVNNFVDGDQPSQKRIMGIIPSGLQGFTQTLKIGMSKQLGQAQGQPPMRSKSSSAHPREQDDDYLQVQHHHHQQRAQQQQKNTFSFGFR